MDYKLFNEIVAKLKQSNRYKPVFIDSYIQYITKGHKKSVSDSGSPDVLLSEDITTEYIFFLSMMKEMHPDTFTFSDSLNIMLFRKKKKAPEIYKAAGIDARHFSKMISNKDYRPNKDTVFALAIALHLSVYETADFLATAGYAFSPSSLFDQTIKFFLEKEFYDRKTIDSLMSDFNLPLLPQNWS